MLKKGGVVNRLFNTFGLSRNADITHILDTTRSKLIFYWVFLLTFIECVYLLVASISIAEMGTISPLFCNKAQASPYRGASGIVKKNLILE